VIEGDEGTRGQGDKGMGGQGDKGTRGWGDKGMAFKGRFFRLSLFFWF